MSLTRCTLQSRTLNVDDSASSARGNSVKLIDVTLTGQSDAGLLIQLTDPKDRIIVKNSAISYPLGIAFHAPGSRILPDEGGKVLIRKSTLTVSDPTSAGLAATASTSGRGTVIAAKTVIDSPGIIMVAKRCKAVLNGKRIDCKASTWERIWWRRPKPSPAPEGALRGGSRHEGPPWPSLLGLDIISTLSDIGSIMSVTSARAAPPPARQGRSPAGRGARARAPGSNPRATGVR